MIVVIGIPAEQQILLMLNHHRCIPNDGILFRLCSHITQNLQMALNCTKVFTNVFYFWNHVLRLASGTNGGFLLAVYTKRYSLPVHLFGSWVLHV